MLEVVERDVVVVAVHLKQEVLQDVRLDVERRQEVQVGEHHLQQRQHLRLLPLPVSSRQPGVGGACECECVSRLFVLTSCQTWES